jgi:hypothetical protein
MGEWVRNRQSRRTSQTPIEDYPAGVSGEHLDNREPVGSHVELTDEEAIKPHVFDDPHTKKTLLNWRGNKNLTGYRAMETAFRKAFQAGRQPPPQPSIGPDDIDHNKTGRQKGAE